jgi:hypothetical protein
MPSVGPLIMAASPAARRHGGPISRRLLGIGRSMKDGTLTLGELVDRLGGDGLGILLLVLTLPALIPLPGPFGMLFGAVVALVTIQLMGGLERLWIPATLRRRRLPGRALRNMIRGSLALAAYAERGLREDRLSWLTGRRARMALALPLLVMAITIILPIPLGNVLPALALIAAAAGLMARDGLAVLVSLVIAVLAIIWTALVLMFGAVLAEHAGEALAPLLAWLGDGVATLGRCLQPG